MNVVWELKKRGYAGIGAVWSYIQLLLAYFDEIGGIGGANLVDTIGILVFFFGFPIFMLAAAIPSLIFLDVIKEHSIRSIRNSTKEIGITRFVEVSIKEVDQQ